MKFNPPHMLSPQLWHDGPEQRSRELTPLYVEHYYGPFTNCRVTYHDYWELLLVRSGAAHLLTSPVIALTPGTVCLLPPGTEHAEHGAHHTEIFWIGLQGSRLDAMNPHTVACIISDEVVRSVLPLWTLAQQAYGQIGPELDGLALILFNRFRRQMGEDGEEAIHPRMDQALAYLHAHAYEEIAMPELAALCGYSEGHFYRTFKRLTGKTPLQYVTMLRLNEARHWLRYSDLPINEIARRLGFSTAQYFSYVFKHATGQSPTDLRSQSAL